MEHCMCPKKENEESADPTPSHKISCIYDGDAISTWKEVAQDRRGKNNQVRHVATHEQCCELRTVGLSDLDDVTGYV